MEKKLYSISFLLIVLFILIGVFFASSLNIDMNSLTISTYNSNMFEIFFHNLLISLCMIFFSLYFAIPTLIVNSLYLGIISSVSISYRNLYNTTLLSLHIPLEIIGWVITIQLSYIFTKMVIEINYRYAIYKLFKLPLLYYLIIVYLLAALIENFIGVHFS